MTSIVIERDCWPGTIDTTRSRPFAWRVLVAGTVVARWRTFP